MTLIQVKYETACLKDKNPEVRTKAAIALGKTFSPLAVEPLIISLDDENEEVCKQAIAALAMIRDDRAIEPLLEKLKTGDWGVRWQIAEALGYFDDRKASNALTDLFCDDEEEAVRTQAADSLQSIKARMSYRRY